MKQYSAADVFPSPGLLPGDGATAPGGTPTRLAVAPPPTVDDEPAGPGAQEVS